MPDEMVLKGTRNAGISTPTARDIAAVFFRQGRIFAYTFGFVLLAVVLYGMLFPSYEAHMEILLRRGRQDPVVTAQQNPPVTIARPEISEEEVNSEVELLKDEDLLRAVVEGNRLAEQDRLSWIPLRDIRRDTEVSRAVRRLGRKLKAEPIRKTNLIRISFLQNSTRSEWHSSVHEG